MEKGLLGLSLTVLVIITFAVNVSGQEAKPEPAPQSKPALSPKEMKELVKDIKDYLGLSIYLQGGYTYNFRDPDSGINRLPPLR